MGIPTANFNEEVVAALPNDLETGIYFGWTNLEGDENHKNRKAVISIGWNPFYDNSKKSVVSNLHNYRGIYFYFCAHKCAGRVFKIQSFRAEFFRINYELMRTFVINSTK